VNESRGLPAYPPARNAWEFPPPPISRRWKWIAAAVSLLSVVTAIGLASVAFTIGGKDIPGMIDDDRVLSVISRECDIMTSTVISMPVAGSPEQQAAIIADQDAAVEHMLTAIRSVDAGIRHDDRPTDDWLADWDRLIGAREHYAELVRDGYEPDLEIPRDPSGNGIYQRMNRVWYTDAACIVPFELLTPYPADDSDV
jgi:hypothetical protein